MPQTPSTRWCPTPEQLMILEEMYRSGVRTPNAAEIQQITAHLAYYGRIEGKNVFYWFQNHKARERQRLRRRLCARHQQQYAQAQQQQAAAAASPAAAALAVAAPPHAAGGSSGSVGASSGAGVHPAVLQLHHHHPYATSFMPLPQGGYFQPEAAPGVEFAGCKVSGGSNLQLQLQEEDWTAAAAHMECSGSSCCGRQPLKTLELFPTKSTGLKDECCSSSKSSSCSTSTN